MSHIFISDAAMSRGSEGFALGTTRRNLVLSTVSGAAAMVNLDLSAVNISLGDIQSDLGFLAGVRRIGRRQPASLTRRERSLGAPMSAERLADSTGTRRLTRTSGAGRALLAAVAIAASACSGSADSESSPSATTTGAGTLAARESLDHDLIDAAWANDVSRARDLIAEGADVNAKDSTEQSAYLIATSEGDLELLNLTLEQGADVTALDSFNGTGLIRAAERGHARVVGRLLQTDIDVNHINNLGWTALHESIILGTGEEEYVDTVRLLVAGGADVTLPPRDGTAPIEIARTRDQDVVVATLQAALDAEPPDDANELLLGAAASGDADAVAVALAAGAEIETRDANLRAPLLLAASDDHLSVVRLLVALGADPDAG